MSYVILLRKAPDFWTDISEKRRKTTTTTTTQIPRSKPGYEQSRKGQNPLNNRNGVSDRQSDKNNVIVTIRDYFNQTRKDPYGPSIVLPGKSIYFQVCIIIFTTKHILNVI